jgi:hypothetical protein
MYTHRHTHRHTPPWATLVHLPCHLLTWLHPSSILMYYSGPTMLMVASPRIFLLSREWQWDG